MKKFVSSILASAMLLGTAMVAQAADKIRLAVTDIEGLEQLQQEFGPFAEALKKSTSSSPAMGPLADQLAIDPTRLLRVLRRLEGEKTVVAVAANRYFLTETMHNYAVKPFEKCVNLKGFNSAHVPLPEPPYT